MMNFPCIFPYRNRYYTLYLCNLHLISLLLVFPYLFHCVPHLYLFISMLFLFIDSLFQKALILPISFHKVFYISEIISLFSHSISLMPCSFRSFLHKVYVQKKFFFLHLKKNSNSNSNSNFIFATLFSWVN